MSDTANGAAAAVEAPATEQPQQVQTPEQPLASRSAAKEAARQGARDDASALLRPEPAGTKANRGGEQPHDEKGKYLPKDAAAASPSGETPAAEPAAPPADETPATAPVPDGFVRIDLPADHPMRARGKTFLDVPKADEDFYRSQVNNPVRRAELERTRKEADELRRRLAETERERTLEAARQRALTDPEIQKLRTDPKIAEARKVIVEEFGEDVAKLLDAGLEKAQTDVVAREELHAQDAIQKVEAAKAFATKVADQAPDRFAVWAQNGKLNGQLGQATKEYAQWLQTSGSTPNVDQFFDWLDTQYVRDPDVQAAIRAHQDAERKKLVEEAEARTRASLAAQERADREAAATRRQNNPLGGGAGATALPRTIDPQPGDVSIAGLNKTQIKQALRSAPIVRR